jgi:hypothetical protein
VKSQVAVLLALVSLAGCASIVDGSSQSLSVKTVSQGADVAGAQCTLTNNKGVWYVTTPGSVTVHRSYDDMNVKCTRDGYVANVGSVSSSTKGMAFGNILFGGFIGAGVDMGTGAAYDYPSPLILEMQPANKASASAIPTS